MYSTSMFYDTVQWCPVCWKRRRPDKFWSESTIDGATNMCLHIYYYNVNAIDRKVIY